MQLTLRQATEYLDVSEDTLRRWIKQRGLPVHVIHERMHLNAIELWEWATENGIPVSKRLLQQERRVPESVPALSDMLEKGGIHYDVGGNDRSSVLREVVARLPLPPEVDREYVGAVLEAREAMGSTGIGDGVAIPHVRNPILLQVGEPRVTLCLLRHPIEFEAIDGRPVYALFTVVSSTVPAHLRILAQLGYVLRDPRLKALLESRAPVSQILERVRELESMAAPGGAGPRP
jgi:PTS system nitrogen regulatory IIA component